MQTRSEILARIQEQLAAQSSDFRDLCSTLENLDPRALLPVREELLREIDRVCDERTPSRRSFQVMGLRA
jgi:hypothetical protein